MGMQSRAKVRVRPFPLSVPSQPEPFKAARALVRRKFLFPCRPLARMTRI